MTYQSTIAADSPLHWWRLSTPGGALCVDNGSAPIHLFNPNNTQLFPYTGVAADGGSGFFPGNSNVIDLDLFPAQVSPLSIEAWVWQFSLQPNPAVQAIFGWNGITAGIQLGVDATGHPSFTAQLLTTAPAIITEQAWHHIVGTKTGALEALYVDGALVNSQANAVAMNFAAAASIGAVTTAARFFRGWITEVAFYNFALTAAQVAAHHAAQEVTTLPLFFGHGHLDITSGALSEGDLDVSTILASVRKVY